MLIAKHHYLIHVSNKTALVSKSQGIGKASPCSCWDNGTPITSSTSELALATHLRDCVAWQFTEALA